jgi:hypothetical protein
MGGNIKVSCLQVVGGGEDSLNRWSETCELVGITRGEDTSLFDRITRLSSVGPVDGQAVTSAGYVRKSFGLTRHSVKIAGFFTAGVRQHGAAVSTGATLDQ